VNVAHRVANGFESACTAVAPVERGKIEKLPPDPRDPFDPAALVPAGPYKGLRYDTRYGRSVHLLSPAEAAPYHPAPGEVLVANFGHQGSFWIARVPPDAVKDVIFQEE